MTTRSPQELNHFNSLEPYLNPSEESHSGTSLSGTETSLGQSDGAAALQQVVAQKTAEHQYLHRQLQEVAQENQELKTQLQWYEDTEHALVTIAAFNYQSHHLVPTFQDVVFHVQSILQADRVCLYQLQADQSSFVMAEAVRSEWPAMLGFLIRDLFVSGATWLERYQNSQICLIPDLTNLNDLHQSDGASQNLSEWASQDSPTNTLLHYFQVKAKLVLPIQVHQTLWGLLVVHQCAAPRSWQQTEVNFLKRLTWQLGVVLGQTQLNQELQVLQEQFLVQRQNQTIHLQQALAFEAMLTRITDHVRDSLDEQQILQTALQELTTVLEVQGCQAVLCDPIQATCGLRFEYRDPLMAAGDSEPRSLAALVDSIPHTGELCDQIHQGGLFQFCLTEPFLNRGQEAILIAPILDDQGCLGSLRVFTHRSHSFDLPELRVVQQVVNHCAIAIRQARLFQASQTQLKAMERLSQLKDDFLSTISHELRTPLSSIKMVTNLLKLCLITAQGTASDHPASGDSSAKVAQYLKVLEEECDREIHLIDDLLATQHLNTGDHPISLISIQLQDWIPHITETFAQRLQTRDQTLELIIPHTLPPLVTDTFMLNRILVELVNNACKYTPAGEHITVAAGHTPTQIEIAVQNTGIEIAPEELIHIFEPFYRIPNSDPWKQSGTGLGLSLIKKLVEHLGGTIQVESFAHQVCFKIHFPLLS